MFSNCSLKTLVYQIALIVIATSLCLNPSQPDGRCTSCASIEVLFNGSCFPKIRGCLRHLNGIRCSQCQFGYVFSNSTCIRQAIFYNRTNLSQIPPSGPTPTKNLTFEDIRFRVGQQYGVFFTDAHEYFVSKYTNELGRGNIRQVQTLQVKTGPIIVIVYQSSSSSRFQAVAKKNLDGRIQQWSFGASNQKRDPVTANALIKKALGTRLDGFVLYNVKQQGDIFTFDYMNEKDQVIRVKVNRNDLAQTNIASNLASKLNVAIVQIWDLALQDFKKKYSKYTFSEVTQVRKVDQYYIVSLGQTTTFSFRVDNYQLSINKPIEEPVTSYVPNTLMGGAQIGSSGDYKDALKNSQLQSITTFILNQFPSAKQAQVISAKNKVLSTGQTNYYFLLRKAIPNSINFEEYQFLVRLRADKIAEMVEARLNGKLIYQKEYNYNTDTFFFNTYRVISQSKVANIPPISSVTFMQEKNRKYYKVKYSEFEFAELQYLIDTKTPNLISYYVDGEDVIRKLKGPLASSTQRSPDLLLNFIKSQNPNITAAQIQSVTFKAPSYTVTLVTSTGKYIALITDKGGQLVLNQLNYLSNLTCYDLDLNQQKNQLRVKFLTDFLRQNYPLQSFDVKLAQVRVQSSGVPQIRLLFANPQQKQIQIMLQDTNVLRASYINFGYQMVSPTSQAVPYTKIIEAISTLKGTKVPLYTEQNGTLYHSFYDDTKSTYELFYDVKAAQLKTQVVNTRPYVLIPDGFSFSGLLVPGETSDAEKKILDNIVKEVTTKYSITLINSVLVYANKVNNTYNLMFKTNLGYQRIDLNYTNGVITYGKLILTTYKDTDFSNCKRFDLNGKCLSCNQTTQVQYQGYCFQRIEGCNVQLGKVCVKCAIPYVRSNFRCFKQCFNFFR